MKRQIVVSVAVLLSLASLSLAGPLVPSHIGADADWVAHINHDRFNATTLSKLVRGQLAQLGAEEKLAGFAQIFGFHPIDDLHNITIYGTGPNEEKAVVLAEGNFDLQKLLALVSMNPQHEEFGYHGVTMHKWLQVENKKSQTIEKTMYGCIYKGNTVVISRGRDAAQNAVDVLAGRADAVEGLLDQSAVAAKGAFIQIAARNVDQIAAQQGQAAIFKQSRALSLAVGEADAKFYVSAVLTAANAEAAQAVTKMAEGVLAFASLATEEQPRLAQLAKAVQLSTEGNLVSLYGEVDSQVLFGFLLEQWQKNADKQTGEK